MLKNWPDLFSNVSRKLAWLMLIILVMAGLGLRLWKLNQIPVSYYHDEIDYVFTGQSVAQLGTDITGNWSPWQLRPLHTYNFTAEMPAAWQAVMQSMFGLGAQSGHVTSAVFGLLTVLLTTWLSYQIWGNKKIALLSGLVLLINPWHVYISRMSYEVVISLLGQVMLLAGLVLLFKKSQKKFVTAVALILGGLLLGYFNYHGAKLTLIVVSFVGSGILLWPWPQKPNRQRVLASGLLGLCILGLGFYSWLLASKGYYGGRAGEFIWRTDFLAEEVNLWRRQAIIWPGLALLVNKYSIFAWEAIKRYLSVFDVYRLLVSGYESGFQFSLAVHGFGYLTSLVFLPWGVYTAWKKDQALTVKLLILLAVSPVASTFNLSFQSIFRSALTYYLLLLFVGVGWADIWLVQFKKSWQKLLLALVLTAQVLWFATQYFGTYPVISSENHYFDQELLAAYVQKTNTPLEIYVDDNSFQYTRSIVFYNQLISKLEQPQRQQFGEIDRDYYQLPNITIKNGCPPQKNLDDDYVLSAGIFKSCGWEPYVATAAADLKYVHTLSSPRDSHAYFYLLPDLVCNQEQVSDYIYAPSLRLYNPHQLDTATFCRSWVKREKLPETKS